MQLQETAVEEAHKRGFAEGKQQASGGAESGSSVNAMNEVSPLQLFSCQKHVEKLLKGADLKGPLKHFHFILMVIVIVPLKHFVVVVVIQHCKSDQGVCSVRSGFGFGFTCRFKFSLR